MLPKGSFDELRRFLNHSGVSSLSEDIQSPTYRGDFQSNKFIATNIRIRIAEQKSWNWALTNFASEALGKGKKKLKKDLT
jgi:hypothetical protein